MNAPDLNPVRRAFGLRDLHGRLSGRMQELQSRESDLTVKVAQAKGRLALADDVDETLTALQRRAHERAVGIFESLLTAIVADVLPGKSGVKLALGTERGAAALDVQLQNGEFLEDADGSGGAVTNVLCAGLRFAALSRTQNRKFMLLDEPDCWLKPSMLPAFTQVLVQVSAKAATQTLLISHHDPAYFEGLAGIVRLTGDGPGRPTGTQVLEPHMVDWPDDETPGIRSIRLLNFRAHTDTTLPLFPGVTVLSGDNDLGKTTLARTALLAVAYGESADTVLQHGAKEARVEIRLENNRTLEWVRKASGSPKVLYRLREGENVLNEGRPAKRGEVPEWAQAALGIARVDELDIQLGNQKSPVFLLDEPASTRARLLSVGRESGRLHALMEAYADIKRKDRETTRTGEQEIATLRDKLAAGAALEGQVDALATLAGLAGDIERFKVSQDSLQRRLARLSAAEAAVSRASEIACELELLPERTPELLPSARLGALVSTMESALRRAGLSLQLPEVTVPVLAETQTIVTLGQRLNQLAKKLDGAVLPDVPVIPEVPDTKRITRAVETLTARASASTTAATQLAQVESGAAAAKRQIEALVQELGGHCPTCGGGLTASSYLAAHAHGA